MSKGFQPENTSVIEVIKRRLRPACQREDGDALTAGFRKMADRYGWDAIEGVLPDLMGEFPWIMSFIGERLPEEAQQMLFAESFESVAGVIEKAGLRLEDHFRVSDRGIAVTHQARDAIAATGFPKSDQFGGNDDLADVGINRAPFKHPLSEVSEHNGEPFLNNWAAASIFINAAQGWIADGDPDTAKSTLSECLKYSKPTASLEMLLRRSRYDDRVLMEFASWVSEGFDIVVKRQIDKD